MRLEGGKNNRAEANFILGPDAVEHLRRGEFDSMKEQLGLSSDLTADEFRSAFERYRVEGTPEALRDTALAQKLSVTANLASVGQFFARVISEGLDSLIEHLL